MGPKEIDATMIRVRSTHNRLRTDTVEGYYLSPPKLGQPFEFYGPPLEGGDFRRITTTAVQRIEYMGETIQFGTWNSLYRLNPR